LLKSAVSDYIDRIVGGRGLRQRVITQPRPLADSAQVRQKLLAIGARACSRNLTLEPGFQRHSHFFGAHESPADIYIFRSGVKRNQPIAVPAVRLKPVAYSLRPLPKNLRAFRAFYFDFFVDHETPLAD
jgi:hypothetical protein